MPKNYLRAFARLIVGCAACVIVCAAALAQSQATSGNIEGRVLDPNGAAVPGATVTATSQQTGFERRAASDEDGVYRLILLPPGTYRVTASGTQGFQPATLENVQVTVGGQTALDINLSVSGTQTVVDVGDEVPTVETGRTSISTTVNERSIENLPVNGRNYLDFATLTPGVIRDPTRVGDLSVGGQKGTLNNLQVDGADNNNTFFGQAFGRTGVRPPYQFSEESVKEFQVNQNGFSAEFGRAGGAVINVVTKSGTNEFHGGLFEYFRDESLNANLPNVKAQTLPGTTTPRPNKRPPSQINQYGGRLGGPIVKDRAFFFFTYDGQRTNFLNVLEVPAIPAALQSFFQPRLAPYQVDRDQDVLMAKVDWAVDDSNQLSLRFNRQNFTGVNNEFTGAQAAEEHSGNSLAKTTTMAANLASTFSPQIVNEFRFQLARDEEPGTANVDAPELLIRSAFGTLNFGRNNFSPRETTINRVQIVDNVSYVRGAHNVRGGVDAVFDNTFNFFPGFFSGQYQFNSFADFQNNNPSSYTQRFAGVGTLGATSKPNTQDYALFLQDDWRATPSLTINAGVRYDYQALADPPIQNTDAALLARGLDTSFAPRDRDNFAPRVGFSYAFDGRTVLRGGYGLFYGRTTGIMLGTAHTGNGIQTFGLTVTDNAATAVNEVTAAGFRYPFTLAALPPGTLQRPDLFLFSPDYEQPYVQQGRLGVEREVMRDLSVSATYLFFKGVHLARTRDVNLGTPVQTTVLAPDDTPAFSILRFPAARPLPAYARVNLFESTGNSRYDGLALEARRRFARGFQFLASYTYSVAKDDRPDFTAVVPRGGDDAKIVQNQLNIGEDYSFADADLRHRFVFSPVYEIGRVMGDNSVLGALFSDFTLSGIVQLQSGFAYSQGVNNADVNRDDNARSDRVPGTCRNCFRTPATYQFDARVARRIRLGEDASLRLILEGFNIFNRANVAATNASLFNGFDTITSGPLAGQLRFRPVSAATPFGSPRLFLNARELQLAIKFDF